jgi:hypothetical protein
MRILKDIFSIKNFVAISELYKNSGTVWNYINYKHFLLKQLVLYKVSYCESISQSWNLKSDSFYIIIKISLISLIWFIIA